MLLKKLPYSVAYFLGYREAYKGPKALPNWRIYFWTFLGSWISISVISCICTYGTSFKEHNTPIIIASFGASAVLLFGVIDSPLAQPRNVIGGHLISSIIGCVISELFLGIKKDWDPNQFLLVQWIGGATSMALSLFVMQLTKTVHPPGGATALIALVTNNIVDMKWFYIAVVFVSSIVQVAIACLINNIERKYPQYWWEPEKLPIEIDPKTLSTILSTHHIDEEEGKHHQHQQHSPNTSDNDTLADDFFVSSNHPIATHHHEISVEQAILALKHHAHTSDTKYALILPNSNNVIHNYLNPTDLSTLESIIKQN